MELSNIIQILWRRKWAIVATIFIAGLTVVFLVMQLPDRYRVTTTLRILTPDITGAIRLEYADRLTNTYLRIIDSDQVMADLMERLDLENEPTVSLRALQNTELLELSVEGRDPEVANTLAEILIANNPALYYGQTYLTSEEINQELGVAIEELADLYADLGLTTGDSVERNALELEDRLRLQALERRVTNLQERYDDARLIEQQQASSLFVVQPAEVPEHPYAPNRLLMVVLGIAVSGIAGIGMAFIFENLDNKLYTNEQIEKITGTLPLAYVPMAEELKGPITDVDKSFALESFRTLRTKLLAMMDENPDQRVFLISSADPKEGKTVTTAFLALMIAQSGKKVVVVDGDMRLPRQHDLFQLSNDTGLSSLLSGNAELEKVIQFSEATGVHVITSGPVVSNSSELLTTQKTDELLKTLQNQFDVVLVDTPPLNVVSDTVELLTHVDDIIIVVTRNVSTRKGVRQVLSLLQQVDGNLVGVVINHAERRFMSNYYYQRTIHYSQQTDKNTS